ncbi:MAG: hypothetical protein LC777_01320 [Actinobacteria bacterium]|nr:hypothetical protein [Actinomycetota bacterium]
MPSRRRQCCNCAAAAASSSTLMAGAGKQAVARGVEDLRGRAKTTEKWETPKSARRRLQP